MSAKKRCRGSEVNSKKKKLMFPLSQELIVNLLAVMSEGILQLHKYSIPIRASPLLRSDEAQGQKRVLLN